MSRDWDPGRYARFGDERSRPALELLARVPDLPAAVITDLGCGAGEITRRIAERWPGAAVEGVDASAAMLEAAARTPSRVTWRRGRIEDWAPERPRDLVFANASLHWVPDHEQLFLRLLATLGPGGVLAIQMPLSHEAPSHRLMREVLDREQLGEAGWRAALEAAPVLAASRYHALLRPHVAALDAWETEYLQELEGEDAVLRWVETTGLRRVRDGLDEAGWAHFLPRYREALREAYPRGADGRTLYPFRRLFLVARTS